MDAARPAPSRLAAAAAGVVAGSLGLGTAELFAGLVAGAPSPILAIGALLISLQPPNAKQIVVDLFGTADKAALSVAVLIGALVLAAALGLLERARPQWGRIGFAVLGLLVLLAAIRDPLADLLLATIGAALATAVSVLSLPWLMRLATPRRAPAEARMLDFDRRRFLGTSLALAGTAAASGVLGRFLLERRSAQQANVPPVPAAAEPAPSPPPGSSLDVDGITPLVIPNDQFYRIDTSLLVPHLDASSWTLSLEGMVDNPITLTYAELLAMPMFE
ncbi:MAG TPA: oxidoreductase, partial [Candidatus Limnocylindria bacterium]|nr:oxidoreductase [Candidatus Limnocylindria bacterium]